MLIYLSMIETEEEKSKFTRIYEKYRKLMFYVANRILQDDYLSEDAVHQAFLKIIDHLDKISENDCHKTKSYMVIIVRNCAINLYNQRKNHPTVSLDENPGLAEDRPFEIEELDLLTKAVAKLPEIYRDILTLKYVHDLSNGEIAETLNLSEPTVRKRIERAKSRICEIIEKENEDDCSLE